jgi:UDP-GlcNAc3NAcA epimerase
MPEEINRVLTDHASDLLFAPTAAAIANLRREGLPEERLHLVGDVMYDAALFYKDRAYPPAWFRGSGLMEGGFVLATVHRAENTDDPERLRGILEGLGGSVLPVILPLHPRTRAKIDEFGLTIAETVRVVAPVGYLEMVWLELHSALIATDSGGVQKEAYFHGKGSVTLREETEWVELVESGWNVLVGTDAAKIATAVSNTRRPTGRVLLYGNGDAAKRIVGDLV